MLLANSNLPPTGPTGPEFRRLEAAGLMIRPDDRRLVICHRNLRASCRHLRDLPRSPASCSGGLAFWPARPADRGLGGMVGAAARRDQGTAAWCSASSASGADRAAARAPLPDVRATTSTTPCTGAVAVSRRELALSIGVVGNAAEVVPELLRRAALIDVVTDQTRPTTRCPTCPSARPWMVGRHEGAADPEGVHEAGLVSDGRPRRGDGRLRGPGRGGVRLRQLDPRRRRRGGYHRAFDFLGSCPPHIRPQFERGRGPFRAGGPVRWPTSPPPTGRSSSCSLAPTRASALRITLAGERVAFEGPSARSAGSATASGTGPGWGFNEMVASGEVSLVRSGAINSTQSVASPYRGDRGDDDLSDAVADWPLPNALVNTASGASGCRSTTAAGSASGARHAGQVCVADGN
ncbi:hypothetical protein HBB16_02020 [Pseudonocardia sp. MCCB 268]|nr:hypothetical protein [Pseudonocardia cytotoxica]